MVFEPADQAVIDFVVRSAKALLAAHKVILFGSRARGDALARSDFDFAIEPAEPNTGEWSRFCLLVEDKAPTLRKIDLINLRESLDGAFRKRITDEGTVVYEA